MDQTPTTRETHGLCVDCDYPLKGLSTRRCPECGRPFDPADARTMNMGRPLSALSRWLLTPTGRPLLAVALIALAVLLWLSDVRALTLELSAAEFAAYVLRRDVGVAFGTWTADERVLSAALMMWGAGAAFWAVRAAGRAAVALARRRWRHRPPDHRRKSLITLILLLTAALLIVAGYPARVARTWMASDLASRAAGNGPVAGSAVKLPKHRQLLVLRAGARYLSDPRRRTAAIDTMLGLDAAAALPVLRAAVAREREPAVLAGRIHLLCLYRDMADAPLFESLLDHQHPAVSAAAADALGILHQPAYPIPIHGPVWARDGAWIASDPPIHIDPLLVNVRDSSGSLWGPGRDSRFPGQRAVLRFAPNGGGGSVAMPAARLARLRRMMLEAPTAEQREAAARATLPWPPDGHALRVTEWAVWRSAGGDWPEAAMPAPVALPQFVHGRHLRLGGQHRAAGGKCMLEKSVILMSASQLLAVDVEVELSFGQPYLAYPRPDEAAMIPQSRGRVTEPGPGDLATASGLRDGYPWLAPSRRPVDWRTGLPRLRWQSVIVTPQPLPWMRLPAIPEEQREWARLRDSSASWLSSRGETERFLFCDGPTFYASPVRLLDMPAGTLMLDRQPVNHWPMYARHAKRGATPRTPQAADRRCVIAVTVTRGAPNVKFHRAPDEAGGELLVASEQYNGEAVLTFFKRLLVSRGMTDAESQTLVDLWGDDFFAREGRRLLVLLSSDDYHGVCPIRIRPAPAALHRVGIIVSEQ